MGPVAAALPVTVLILNNKVLGMDVTIEKTENMKIPASDFVLKLVAEDALPAQDTPYSGEGSGTTKVAGNLNIKGMNVLLQGVAMALGRKVI